MEKTFIMRLTRACAVFETVKITGLSLDIKPQMLTVIRTPHSDAVRDMITGDALAYDGTVVLAGKNVAQCNANERRVAKMPQVLTCDDIRKQMRDAVREGVDNPTVYERKRSELRDKIAELKKEKKADAQKRKSVDEAIKKAEIDITALGLKMNRRKSELELNMKAAKSLLASISSADSDMRNEHMEKMQAKLFSARYEFAMYSHKHMSDSVLNERLDYVMKRLSLSEADEITKLFACAYVKAPELILYCGTLDDEKAERLNTLAYDTGVAVAAIISDDDTAYGGEPVNVDKKHFKVIE
ncbi:MAG: hypothetical protein IJO93_01130 [Clostridia bacterium]|nr:hypothetical protein [Clostridia bacterium]